MNSKNILAMQRSLVVYPGISRESLAFSQYTHELQASYVIRAAHDGKVRCNTEEFTAALLYFLWHGRKVDIHTL